MTDAFWSEKIVIEPDLGDQRKSIYKALPPPPTTPRRVLVKYRFSAVFACLFAGISFVLSSIVVLAGTNADLFSGHSLIVLNTTRLGQDVIKFEPARTNSTSQSASSAQTKLADALNSLSRNSPLGPSNPNSPLHDSNHTLDMVMGNSTAAIHSGFGTLVNNVTEQIVASAGVKDKYIFYVQKICSETSRTPSAAVGDRICSTYHDAKAELSVLSRTDSAVTIGKTTITIPLLAQLPASAIKILTALDALRTVVFAFLVAALVFSASAMLTSIPAMVFPHAKILVYINMFGASMATTTTFIAAVLVTILIVGVTFLGSNLINAIGISIVRGGLVLLFVWLAWLCSTLSSMYWIWVWFRKVRGWIVVHKDYRNRSKRAGSESTLGSFKREKGPRVIF